MCENFEQHAVSLFLNIIFVSGDIKQEGLKGPKINNKWPPGGNVFQQTGTIFEHVQDIIGINLLTKFHEDQTINVASTEKCPAPWQHVFQANVNIFEFIRDIIETNILTKFHEDWTINVASRVLTRQMLTPHDGRRTTDKRRTQKLTMSTLCSGELNKSGWRKN
ncbi:hypothetical protein DPMN_055493 [Dreissena polymorpha]|uniref:Uncharacterized protein n=1 Tax=Dreissena polymorpha TaxID=45954 RepID=A0A9D4HQP9_DREPO|nr:hypothetical protein DPMN_055493 [Dreissena polymorpha]